MPHTGAAPKICICAAASMFFMSIARVMGPTPPGTGVIYDALAETSSKHTSPVNFPVSGSRFMATSITTAPGLTISPRMRHGCPAATTSTSA